MTPISFKRHRFPPDVIRLGVWLYYRFTLSLRDVEDSRPQLKPLLSVVGRQLSSNDTQEAKDLNRRQVLRHRTCSQERDAVCLRCPTCLKPCHRRVAAPRGNC